MGVQVSQFESPSLSRQEQDRKVGYLQKIKSELKQVSWTPKDELLMSTKVVVAATFAFGLGIYGVDIMIKVCLTGFKGLIHLVFG